MMNNRQIITIDGPSGVGKSTVSRIIATKFGYTYLDTGAMYRGVGLYFHRLGIAIEENSRITSQLAEIEIALLPLNDADSGVGVLLNGEDVSVAIRTPEMSMVASQIAVLPEVRDFLTEMQRRLAENGKVVAEGRDMGTVVFPNAAFKFFLDGDPKERCKRRVRQLRKKGMEVDEGRILEMILERDKNDSGRAVAPLKKAADAHLIDTTELSVEQVCERMKRIICEKSGMIT